MDTATTTPTLLSISDVRRECGGVALHRVNYALNRYPVDPAQRAGNCRFWTREQLPFIQAALRRVASEGARRD